MSFILDALKKAEAERNRRIAPVLMDARVAPPRRGLPAWAWALGGVLLANLLVLGWLLLREPGTPAPAGTVTASAASAGANNSGAATAGPESPGAGAPGASPPAGAGAAPPAAPGTAPPPDAIRPALPVARPPVARTAPPSTASPRPRTDIDSDLQLPALHELRLAGVQLPDLVLNLHVYDPAPAHRSVMLNGIRLREGEYTPNGVKVERITPAGVVLEAAGRRFRLDAGG
jgi:general secretion pathway protein B